MTVSECESKIEGLAFGELQAECKKRNLSCNGKAVDFRDRLIEKHRRAQSESQALQQKVSHPADAMEFVKIPAHS